jgi:hypothetical protein
MPRISSGPKKSHSIHFPVGTFDKIEAISVGDERSFNQVTIRS